MIKQTTTFGAILWLDDWYPAVKKEIEKTIQKNQEALIQYHQLTQIYILLKMRFIIHFFNEVSDFDTHACNFDLHVIKNMNHELIEMIEIL